MSDETTNDFELPGMWERANFEGGRTDRGEIKPVVEMDEDGENIALRQFLLIYGNGGHDIDKIKQHMSNVGFALHWPEWVNTRAGHLTKAGAQDWIKYLISLEPQTPPDTTALLAAKDAEIARLKQEYADLLVWHNQYHDAYKAADKENTELLEEIERLKAQIESLEKQAEFGVLAQKEIREVLAP